MYLETRKEMGLEGDGAAALEGDEATVTVTMIMDGEYIYSNICNHSMLYTILEWLLLSFIVTANCIFMVLTNWAN